MAENFAALTAGHVGIGKQESKSAVGMPAGTSSKMGNTFGDLRRRGAGDGDGDCADKARKCRSISASSKSLIIGSQMMMVRGTAITLGGSKSRSFWIVVAALCFPSQVPYEALR